MENKIENALARPVDNTPVGTVIAWAGPSHLIPRGWLICNGETVETGQFPELCRILGDYWGPIDEKQGLNVLPDLRGAFLRGVNGTRDDIYADTDFENRASTKRIANEVGSFQSDAFQGHRHSISWSAGAASAGHEPNNTERGDERFGFYATDLTITDPVTDNVNGRPRVAAETRPKNAYVYYIIKARSI